MPFQVHVHPPHPLPVRMVGGVLWVVLRLLAVIVPPVVRYIVDRLDREREDAPTEPETDPDPLPPPFDGDVDEN